jgi:hypothetical protein
MSEFIPKRSDRQNDKNYHEIYTAHLVSKGAKGLTDRFDYLDSKLDNPDNNPDDYLSFEETFHSLLPKEEGLRSYIEDSLKERAGEAVGIEFGGPGVNLFQGFTPGFFKKSIGVTLVDHYRSSAETERSYGTHKILEGDIRSPETYEKIADELQGAKANLIIERLLGGWDYIENDLVLYGEILSKWYDLLADNGLLFAQVGPLRNTDSLFKKWDEILTEQYDSKVELTFQPDPYSSKVFMIRKHPGAPEKLPLIPIRDLLKSGKN